MKTNTPAGGNPTLSPTTAWLRIVMLESFKTHKEKRKYPCSSFHEQWYSLAVHAKKAGKFNIMRTSEHPEEREHKRVCEQSSHETL
ncbi:hypothetical protein F2P79_006083 [Pimephales promelas]|nr:hypothetical protein F2P79_006083 [Pimephales promelas]